MEVSAQNETENPVNRINKKSGGPFGLPIGMVSGLLFFVIILVILNYFTILELNKILPSFFSWMPSQTATTGQKITAVKTGVSQEEKAVYGFDMADLPQINVNHQFISAASINYTYTCRITDIIEVNQTTKRIVTNTGVPGMPKTFQVTASNPPVYNQTANNELQRTTTAVLKRGQLIRITRAYRLKNKTAENNWFAERVVIVPSQNQPNTPATPSAK